jgi:hypothetical protein
MRLLFTLLGLFQSDAQKAMVTSTCDNQMPGAMFVLPTDGRKSLAYIIPCLCDPVTLMTIVIIPFITVKDEAFVKAHYAGVHAVDYQPGFKSTGPLLLILAEYVDLLLSVSRCWLASAWDEMHLVLLWKAHISARVDEWRGNW